MSKVLTAEQIKAIKDASAKQGKGGSRKDAIRAVKGIFDAHRAHKDAGFTLELSDIAPNFAEGMTEGLLVAIGETYKAQVILPEPENITVMRKGEETSVPRYKSATIVL